MDALRVDTALLRAAGTQLRVVAIEFQQADANSDDVAHAVGHSGLAEAVRSFAHNWDNRRAKMVDNIGELAKSVAGVGEAFGWTRNSPPRSRARSERPANRLVPAGGQ